MTTLWYTVAKIVIYRYEIVLMNIEKSLKESHLPSTNLNTALSVYNSVSE